MRGQSRRRIEQASTSNPLCRRVTIALIAFVAWWMTALARADDRVTIASADGRGPVAQLTGAIVDYTGKQLELELANQVRRKIPAEQVLDVQTTYTDAQRAGATLYAKQEYAPAIAKYLEALKVEQRRWVQRRILGQLVRSYRAQGGFKLAGSYFLTLVKDDPDAFDFDSIPLGWFPGESVEVEKQAVEWLNQDNQPIAVLLGASHLLSTAQGPTALQKLQRLVDHRDPRIAVLSEAQLLRTTATTLPEVELQRWQEKGERCPPQLRGGLNYTLGRAWFQRAQPITAALYLLRNPILYPHDHPLAAESLLLAAEALNKTDQRDEAARLARELVTRYPLSRAGREARQRATEWQLEGSAEPPNPQR